MKKILSRIIVPHSKECSYKRIPKENPWSGVLDEEQPAFFGNYAGNAHTKHGRHHYWYRVVCNDVKCKGIKIVHSSVLSNV